MELTSDHLPLWQFHPLAALAVPEQPSQGQIKYFLAQAYVMNGEAEKAEPMLRSVIAWGEAGSAEEASKLLQQLSNAKASDGPGASVDPPSSQ